MSEEIEVFSPLFKCSRKLVSPYGLCTHINTKGERHEFDTRDQELSMIRKTGAGWIRTDFYWWQMQLNDGGFNYDRYDSMMTSVENAHLNLLGILVPPFARNQYDGWNKYVKNVVGRYKCVNCWEVINEADLRYRNPNWSWFKAADYADLLKLANSAIRSQDKRNKIVFSGIGNFDSGFLDSVFNCDVSRYFDVMNVHCYSPKKNEPESFLNYYNRLNTIMKKYRIDKPLWLTECGCPTARGWSSEETQAQRLPRIFLISFALGVDKVFWYNFRSNEMDLDDKECHFGIVHKNYIPKPAFYAYQTLVKMCPDKSKRPELKRRGDVYIAQWKKPNGEKVCGLWTSKKKITLNIRGSFSSYNIYGDKMILFNNSVEVSPSIIYIVGRPSYSINI